MRPGTTMFSDFFCPDIPALSVTAISATAISPPPQLPPPAQALRMPSPLSA